MKKLFFLAAFVVCISTQSGIFPVTILLEKDLAHFTVMPERIITNEGGTHASVQKVTNGTDIFVIKQIDDPQEQFLLIDDVVGSMIFVNAGIPVNHVSLIPYTVGEHLKMYPDRAATLHTYVPGKDLDTELPEFFGGKCALHQKVVDLGRLTWQAWYSLPFESISAHADLPSLFAVDTFIGNADRSFTNIFYDKETDRFWAIDQGAAFTNALPNRIGNRIRKLTKLGYFDRCSAKIIEAMRIYRNMLQQLYVQNQPDIIIETMQSLIPYLAWDAENDILLQLRLDYHRDVINDNYAATKKLITELDEK